MEGLAAMLITIVLLSVVFFLGSAIATIIPFWILFQEEWDFEDGEEEERETLITNALPR